MKLLNPVRVGMAMVTSNAVRSDFPEYDPAINYQIGDRVYFNGRDYESLVHPNTGHQPDISPLQWISIGASNRFKMFDDSVSSQTVAPMMLDVTVDPDAIINSVAVFEVDANTVQITLTDPLEGIVYDRTIRMLDNSAVIDWHSYFFEPISALREIVLTDLPSYGQATIRLVADAGAGTARVGEMVIGRQRNLGVTLFGTSVGIVDYSRKERDQFGNVIIVERRFTRTCDYDISIDTGKVATVQRTLAELRTTPTVFIGNESNPETVLYGFYRNFSIVIDNPAISSATIEVESLV